MSSCVTLACKLLTSTRYPWRGLNTVGAGFSISSSSSSTNCSWWYKNRKCWFFFFGCCGDESKCIPYSFPHHQGRQASGTATRWNYRQLIQDPCYFPITDSFITRHKFSKYKWITQFHWWDALILIYILEWGWGQETSLKEDCSSDNAALTNASMF